MYCRQLCEIFQEDIYSFIYLHSMDPYMAGRPVDIEIVKTTGQIPSII
jgi:hypothetical protein